MMTYRELYSMIFTELTARFDDRALARRMTAELLEYNERYIGTRQAEARIRATLAQMIAHYAANAVHHVA